MLFLLLLPWGIAEAAPGLDVLTVTTGPGGAQSYALSLQVFLIMTALSLLPGALLMTTSFVRITIALSLMRQAMGTTGAPSNQVMVGLALFLTIFIMSPVFQKVYDLALEPYLNDKMSFQEAFSRGVEPVKAFMLAQTRHEDLELFARISHYGPLKGPDQVPLTVLMPAFATSEIKTGFTIGFLLFIPFLVIDLVVASVLMSMGMMMLSPMIISLPFKIMLFVLIDGWGLLFGALVSSFNIPGTSP
ncbi:MAG: flagellar type III secretion system pore protein FliP [Pseudomonadota bacterium]